MGLSNIGELATGKFCQVVQLKGGRKWGDIGRQEDHYKKKRKRPTAL